MEITTMKRHSLSSQSVRRAIGVVGIAGLVALALCFDGNILTRFQIMNTAKAKTVRSALYSAGITPHSPMKAP